MIYLFAPHKPSPYLALILDSIASTFPTSVLVHGYDARMKGEKIIFCFDLDVFGDGGAVYNQVKAALFESKDTFENCLAAMIIVSPSEFYTKRFSQSFIFNMSQQGVSFIGHPLVEVVEGYKNLHTWQKYMSMPLQDISIHLGKQLIERLGKETHKKYKSPKILVLHASQDDKSNTYTLWKAVETLIKDLNPKVLHVENGTIVDCKGCGFTQCIHYSESNSCFYGGQVVMEILPAIEDADIVIWLLPNYNDAISAMLTALINRMTVLYRRMVLHDKSHMAIVVSGNSGGDSVACQLIGALTLNKGFYLPAHFLLSAIANDSGTIMKVPHIKEASEVFAQRIRRMVDTHV